MKTGQEFDILERIRAQGSKLTPKQQKLAKYIISHHQQAAFMNSIELAKAAGVSNPTVIRFAVAMGYTGYAQMQEHMHAMLQMELSIVERISSENSLRSTGANDDVFAVFLQEQENIGKCIRELDPEQIQSAAKMLKSAKKVYVCGFQASQYPAEYTAYQLSKIRADVSLLSDWNDVAFELLGSNSEDVALVVAMPRYPNRTMRVLQELKAHQVPTIVVTDNVFSPCAAEADVLFTMPIAIMTMIDTFSSVFCLLNTLVLGVIEHDKTATRERLEAYEAFIKDSEIYYTK